jgi:hypothetical protein
VVREEDGHEFDALYRRLSPRIMGQAYAMTGSRASAEDLTRRHSVARGFDGAGCAGSRTPRRG